MAELNRVQKCYHCGSVLQTENPEGEGYITPDIFKQFPGGLLLCNSCYKNERFSNSPKEASFNRDYDILLDEIRRKNALVVYTLDLVSFEGSFISRITKKLEGIDVLAIANKRDLLPEEANNDALKEYVAHRLRMIQLSVLDVCITSTGRNKSGLQEMYDKILEYSKDERDVYFIGASSSGKSALISEFLKMFENKTNKMIVTHNFEGTSLRGFRIPISSKHYIFETPGTGIDNSILSKVEKQVANQIIPKKKIIAKKLTMSKGSFLISGGLCALELIDGPKTVIKLFASANIESKVRKGTAEKISSTSFRRGALKPVSEHFRDIKDFDAYDIEITEEGERDIGIAGLGWIHFIGNKQTFRIYVPRGVYVYTTRSKVKDVK